MNNQCVIDTDVMIDKQLLRINSAEALFTSEYDIHFKLQGVLNLDF